MAHIPDKTSKPSLIPPLPDLLHYSHYNSSTSSLDQASLFFPIKVIIYPENSTCHLQISSLVSIYQNVSSKYRPTVPNVHPASDEWKLHRNISRCSSQPPDFNGWIRTSSSAQERSKHQHRKVDAERCSWHADARNGL